MYLQLALLAAQMFIGEITRPRPHKTTFEEFVKDNSPSEIRPVPYIAGTVQITPSRIWYGDFSQRAVERDSHWTDYIFFGAMGALLDFITVAYRYYCGECFALCFGPDTHVEAVHIADRLMFQAAQGADNAGGGFLIDDPDAWGGDQPPGEGGQYSWCDITRGNYTDPTNAYLESLLSTPPNKTPALRGISLLVSRGRSGFTESGYFAAGGIGFTPRFKEWKVTVRRQPDNLATGFNKVGRHANPMEVYYEHSTSIEYGARIPVSEINLASWQSVAQALHTEGLGWSGKIENPTSPLEVCKNIESQCDMVMDESSSLGLTARLIRRDYSFGSLRVLNQDVITSVERFSPGTYEDTVNKIIVPFDDPDNNFQPRPGIYIDPANQTIQGGRIVPQTQDYIGVGDYATANMLATRDGRALSIPRAPLECDVIPSFGRLTYRGEVLLFQWTSPTFTKVMRVLAVTPGNTNNADYGLVLIEDQFASGVRTFGEPSGSEHTDPAVGLDTAPPSATWNDVDFPPDGLIETLVLVFTEHEQVIQGGITFGAYTPGGQYARIYVTEPGGVQTLSPIHLAPDDNLEATFNWPALAEGTYEFCVETYSLHNVTNGVKVCASIVITEIGSPSVSPSASVSPSVSPSASVSPSVSPSSSASASISASVSPSSSASPSGAASGLTGYWMSGAEHELAGIEKWSQTDWVAPSSIQSGITDAHGRVYFPSGSVGRSKLGALFTTVTVRMRFRPSTLDANVRDFLIFREGTNLQCNISLGTDANGTFIMRNGSTVLETSSTGLWAIDNWFYMEAQITIGNAGSWLIKFWDDSLALIATLSGSGDTQGSANPDCDTVDWGSTAKDTYIDDLSVDTAGAVIDAPTQVITRYPTGNGDLVQWTRGGVDTGNNYDQVDEAVKDVTSYVQSTAAGELDFYTIDLTSLGGTMKSLQVNALGRAATAGTQEFKLALRIGGVTYEAAATENVTSTTTDRNRWAVWDNNPATGNAWVGDEIVQIGIKSVTADVRIHQVCAEILVEL